MKKKYCTFETVPKSNTRFVERGKINNLITHKYMYMTAHFSVLVQTVQLKNCRVKLVLWTLKMS